MVGCAGVSKKNVELSVENGNQLRNQNVVVSSRPQPDFTAFTPSSALLGGLGALATISKGNRIINDNQISDPARYISSTLANDLMNKYGVKIHSDSTAVTETQIAKIASQFNHSKYILDVQTVRWGYVYYPTRWSRYKVLYVAKLRLIDREKQSIASEGYCESNPEFNEETTPTGDELLADNAKVLIEKIQAAADFCLSEFRTNTLSIGAQFASIPKDVISSSSEIQTVAEAQPSSTELTSSVSEPMKSEVTVNKVNLSGSYISEITTDHIWTFKASHRRLKITLKDNGDTITVTTSPSLALSVSRKGDVLSFSTKVTATRCGCSYVNGEWKVNASGSKLVGSWKKSGGVYGKWNLKKVN